ncbi:MAG: GGDEF domain-containing protein [Nitrospinae bacterium CG11_big_fil_rev_8_21_14_0_20_56_8]|nr:MAG: GGDEF domain-containing protein [Nitrospinae bacterium CG11_big_fil_rev_8_21_14_0_20_56_8]
MLGQSLLLLDHLIYLQKSINLLSSREIFRALSEKLPYILSIKYFSLFLFDKSKRHLKLVCHNHPDLKTDFTIHYSESDIMRDALAGGRYILEQDFSRSRYYRGKKNPLFQCDFFVTLPLMVENEIVGAINLNDSEKGSFDVTDLDFALSAAEFLSLSVSNALLHEQTERLSVTDGLTGLTNHKQMQIFLKNELARSRRYNAPLSIAMLDVDHFKKVNDTYGHQKGDEILMELAHIMTRICRSNDVAARYGGEEFLLILPETPLPGAIHIVDRVREEMASTPFKSQGTEFHVTVSAGVGQYDPKIMTGGAEDLIKVCDHALYQAKEGGRNQTVKGNPDEALHA